MRKNLPETIEILRRWIETAKRDWPYTVGPGARATSAATEEKPWLADVIDRCARFMEDEAARGKPVTSLHLLALAYRDGRISAAKVTDEEGFWRDVLYRQCLDELETKDSMTWEAFRANLKEHKETLIREGRWHGFSRVEKGKDGGLIVRTRAPRSSASASTTASTMAYPPASCPGCGASDIYEDTGYCRGCR